MIEKSIEQIVSKMCFFPLIIAGVLTTEPHHDKPTMWYNLCTPSEDSDQPGHSLSLIKTFTERLKIS